MTLTTIGYGDYSPTTETMQLYTVLYPVLGIGFSVALTACLVHVAFKRREADDEAAAAAVPDEGPRRDTR